MVDPKLGKHSLKVDSSDNFILENINGFHAHVYYDTDSKHQALGLREEIEKKFAQKIQLGRCHDKPVGPHPTNSYQIAFSPDYFGLIVPWLMMNRQGLTILVHPKTENDLIDHRDFSMWLGKTLDLNLDVLT
ncbi:MAG: DOPA 4,5-dioxygenase family protein [Crocosphaera sp.]|nr:DOPA 4,5-dioxygenase family protein [Crocosphaera sp.]